MNEKEGSMDALGWQESLLLTPVSLDFFIFNRNEKLHMYWRICVPLWTFLQGAFLWYFSQIDSWGITSRDPRFWAPYGHAGRSGVVGVGVLTFLPMATVCLCVVQIEVDTHWVERSHAKVLLCRDCWNIIISPHPLVCVGDSFNCSLDSH